MGVWNAIDDRYSKFVLFIEMKPHILIFALFESIFIMTMRNTIDIDTPFFHYIETKPHFLVSVSFKIT